MSIMMTARRFANLSRKFASRHLETHRAYLASHSFLAPILSSDASPEDKLSRCQNALFQNWMTNKTVEVEQGIQQKKTKAPSSRYIVRIYGADGVLETNHLRMLEDGKSERVVKPMEYGAADYASAERAADRKLFSREDAMFAEISNTIGKEVKTRVDRQDAIARILTKPQHPVMKGGKRSAPLHWKPKSHASRNITRWNIMR